MPCLVLLDVFLNLTFDDRIIVLEAYRLGLDDVRLGQLACVVVGHRNDSTVCNGRVVE